MQVVSYVSSLAMPMIILIIVIYAVKEKTKVFDNFLIGAKEGIETTIKIFPTLIGLFVAIGALRASGILELIVKLVNPVLNLIRFPSELMPLALLRPISGSSSIAVATDIMKNLGVDSLIGRMASTIMGSTETTLYTIAIYTSCIKVKKTRGIIIAALTADVVGMIVSVAVCRILSNGFS